MIPGIDDYTLGLLILSAAACWGMELFSGRTLSKDDSRIWKAVNRIAMAGAWHDEAEVELPSRPSGDVLEELAAPGSDISAGLKAILAIDHSFEVRQFLTGASTSYEMIVTAFTDGDRAVLRDLLSAEVYEVFAMAIAERDGRNEHIETSFVSVARPRIVEACVDANSIRITVRFITELVTATRTVGDAIIGGDPKKIINVTDTWTFAREFSSPLMNWKLVATDVG